MGISTIGRGALLLLSGAGAVTFELGATRAFTGLFGGTVRSASVVVAAFLAALALGALLFGRVADRSRRPVLLFGSLAAAGGGLILLVPFLVGLCEGMAVRSVFQTGEARWAVLFLGAGIVVGLPGLALGGTLPALVSAGRSTADPARTPGLLYGANTLGAVLGALLAGFILLETLGTRATLLVAGAISILAGLIGLLLGRSVVVEVRPREGDTARSAGLKMRQLLLSACCAGAAALALEVLGTRLLMQFLHSSAHSFALVLIVFLAGIAGGAAAGSRLAAPAERLAGRLTLSLVGLGILTAASGPALVYLGALAGGDTLRGIWRQAGLALVILPAACASGMVFSLQIARPSGTNRPGSHVGAITLANTIGGVLAALLVGFVCIPNLGVRTSLLLAGLLAVVGAVLVARGPRSWLVALAGAVVVPAVLLPFDLRPLPAHPFFRQLVAFREGPVANVAVMESPAENRPVLFINRTTLQGGGAGALVQERKQGLLPAALHRAPTSALVLGVGTGATISGLLDAGLRNVDAVELVDSVVELLPFFDSGSGNLLLRPEVRFHREDAVTFVRAARKRFDLVVGDLFFPWLDGAGALYSTEHFEAVRERLAPGGIFCQWVPLYQLSWEDFGLVARTFSSVFPQTWILLEEPVTSKPVVGLIGSVEALLLEPSRLDALFQKSRFAEAYQAVNLTSSGDLFELYFGDQYTIEATFPSGRVPGESDLLNTRDRPIVEYRAARTPESEEILALLNLNNLALQLGGSIGVYLDLSTIPEAERRADLERTLNIRSSALTQYLLGLYCNLRRWQPGQDRVRLERKEGEYYLTGLRFEPTHTVLNEAAADLSYRMIQERRLGETAAFATFLLSINPGNRRGLENLALAKLLLGEESAAVELLAPLGDQEEAAATSMVLLGITQYLVGDEEAARVALQRAYSSSRIELPTLVHAIWKALEGDRASAARIATPLVDDPLWGVLARRALQRMADETRQQSGDGGG
ncbi:MAG: MFS transporter [Planctomycetota bacterium]